MSKAFAEEDGPADEVEEDWGAHEDQPPGFEDWVASLPDDRRAMLALDPRDLQREFTHATGRYAWWFERYAGLEDAHARAQGATKLAKARARLAAVLDAKGRKPSKDVLDATVDAHPDVLAAVEAEHRARLEFRRWQGDVEALRHRRDYLVQLGARSRAEGLREPVIREPDKEKRG